MHAGGHGQSFALPSAMFCQGPLAIRVIHMFLAHKHDFSFLAPGVGWKVVTYHPGPIVANLDKLCLVNCLTN